MIVYCEYQGFSQILRFQETFFPKLLAGKSTHYDTYGVAGSTIHVQDKNNSLDTKFSPSIKSGTTCMNHSITLFPGVSVNLWIHFVYPLSSTHNVPCKTSLLHIRGSAFIMS